MKLDYRRYDYLFFVIPVSLIDVFLSARKLPKKHRAGAFAQTVSGVRPIGLNEAYVAIADDANAIWWNPAGMSPKSLSWRTSQ